MNNTIISVEHLPKSYNLGQVSIRQTDTAYSTRRIGTGTFANDLKLWWAKACGNRHNQAFMAAV